MGSGGYVGTKSNKPVDVCSDCWDGTIPVGQAWHRANRTWTPKHGYGKQNWDNPEWYDAMEEGKNTMLMDLWSPNEYSIEEL